MHNSATRSPRLSHCSGPLLAVCLAGLLACSLSPTATHAQIEDRAELVAALDSAATAHVADSVAGAAVAVVQRGDTLLHEGYGKADLDWDVPMPKDAVFQIASLTKQFTAAAILQLAAKDSLRLDAPITEYLPDYNTRGYGVTPRHLLHHTSGIRSFTYMPRFYELVTASGPVRTFSPDTLLALVEAEPFRFAPGTAMSYSNTGYVLLGRIIETVSGQSYAEYVEEHLFGPVGMDDAHYCDEGALLKRRAHGYEWIGGEGLRRKVRTGLWWAFSAGGLCGTAGDLVAWTQALHSGQVLPDSMYEVMTRPGRLADGTELRYAMGLRHRWLGGHFNLQHSGGTLGFLSHLRYYPESGLIVAVLQNTSARPLSRTPRTPEVLANTIARRVLGEGNRPEPGTYAGDRSELAGRYTGPAGRKALTIEIRVENGRLVASEVGSTGEIPLEYRSGLTWTHDTELIEERYRFVRTGGEITELRVDRFHGHLVLRRIDAP